MVLKNIFPGYGVRAFLMLFFVPTLGQPQSFVDRNKACQRCLLCGSLHFCPMSSKCHKCSQKSQCRGKTAKLLAGLTELGFKSDGGVHSERGLFSALQDQAKT